MSVSEKGVAFVTGGAQGLGKAIALRLCADGFDVAVNDVPSNKANLAATVEEIKAKGRRSHAVLGDVSKEEDVKNMIASVVKELGSLDVVSNFMKLNVLYPLNQNLPQDGCQCGNRARIHECRR